MQNFNYHTHTYRCGHADNNMTDEDFVKEFIAKGFNEICFTDHCPEKDRVDKRKYMRMDYEQKDEYLDSIKFLKNKYKDKINIQTGYEVEYLPDQKENLLELKKETDKLVLGQHFIYAKNSKVLKIFRYDNFSDEDLIMYANYIIEAMENIIPDIVVHPDLYMLSRNSFGKVESLVAHMICEAAEKYNIPLEINLTEPWMCLSGKKNNVSYPCKEFWDIASNYNIKVLYGIDAHFKEQIRMYEESIDLANKIIGEKALRKLKFCDKF